MAALRGTPLIKLRGKERELSEKDKAVAASRHVGSSAAARTSRVSRVASTGRLARTCSGGLSPPSPTSRQGTFSGLPLSSPLNSQRSQGSSKLGEVVAEFNANL